MPLHAIRPAAAALAAAVLVLTATAQPPSAQPLPAAPPPPLPEVVVRSLTKWAAADKYPLPHDAKKAEQARRERVAWHAASGLQVFLKTAKPTDPGYEAARAALDQAALYHAHVDLSGSADEWQFSQTRQKFREAVAAGCTDPLVRSRAEWQKLQSGTPDPAAAAAFRRTVDEVCRSAYGDTYKLLAAAQWLSVVRRVAADDPLAKTQREAADQFWVMFQRVAADPHPAAGAAILDHAQAQEAYAVLNGRTRRECYDEVADRLARAKAPPAVRLTAEGAMLVQEGWDARGKGVGATVTPEGARVFGERLAEAKAVLERAWEADKTRPEAANQMLLVCRGLGLDRDELEQWFARAMAANPNNRVAVQRKLDTIHPRWGGTMQNYYGVAWTVASSPNTDAQFPLVVTTSLLQGSPIVGPRYDQLNKDELARFLNLPAVWGLLQTALENQLRASPRDVFVRSMYARVAGAARRYDVAHAQFVALRGSYHTTYFPTQAEFDRWADEARRAVEMKK